jgi:hypothetical protein
MTRVPWLRRITLLQWWALVPIFAAAGVAVAALIHLTGVGGKWKDDLLLLSF